jgi:Fe-S cluster biogenesis protein NfuA
MSIHIELTPNPNAVKFLTEVAISPDQPIHFNNYNEAIERSSLALELFGIKSVKSVFFGSDFITVTKHEEASWDILINEISTIITNYILSGLQVLDKKYDDRLDYSNIDISEIEKQIIEIIESRVRPSVAMDGGDIIYKGFKNGVVQLELRGSCAGCPSSSITLKDGIESMLKHFVPEVESVEAV